MSRLVTPQTRRDRWSPRKSVHCRRWIALGPSDAGERGQGRGEGPAVRLASAQRDALGGVFERDVELTPLVGHLGHPRVRDAGEWSWHSRRSHRDLEAPTVRFERRLQAALRPLDVPENLDRSHDQIHLTGRLERGDG